MNEAFFCTKLVLVEGLEDKALLLAALSHSGRLTDFVRSGSHLVAANGKGGLINMIALAYGFRTPLFVVFDADTNCDAAQIDQNRLLNEKLATLISADPKQCAWPTTDVFHSNGIIWKNDIQTALHGDCPTWFEEVKKVCAELGWEYKRLKKNPSVLRTALDRLYKNGTKIKSLEQAGEALAKFAAN